MGRFNIVFDIGKSLYAKDTKIVIEKAVLTKDSETGKVFAQIKMKNVLSQTLVAVKVLLTGYDVSGEKLEEKEFSYLDLAAKQGREFGQKTPVDFQNSTVRSFNIKITETVYSDGSKLTGTESEYYPVPKPEALMRKLTAAEIKQYKHDNVQTAQYIIKEFLDLWICTCGEMNTIDNDTCYSCGASRENLKHTLDKSLLDEEIKEHIYNEAIAEYRPNNKERISRTIKILKTIEAYGNSKELIARYEAEIAAIDKKEAEEAKARRKNAVKKAGIFTEIAALCVIVVLLLNYVIIPKVKLNNFRKGNFEVGDTVEFGDYHGTVEWMVLDKRDDKALLISKYCLEAKPYNEKYEPVTWETSTLRQWLNGEFINEAFSEKEKALICDTYLQNPDNPEYGTDGGNDTTDKAFLLSIGEATKYFSNDEARMISATGYAKGQGVYVTNINTSIGVNSWWWLRTSGGNNKGAVYVYNSGSINNNGCSVNSIGYGVRPAMWVNVGE